jgi:hypothetical protein
MKADKKATFTAVFPHGANGAGFLLTDVEEGIRRGSTLDNSEGGWKPAELTARTVNWTPFVGPRGVEFKV